MAKYAESSQPTVNHINNKLPIFPSWLPWPNASCESASLFFGDCFWWRPKQHGWWLVGERG